MRRPTRRRTRAVQPHRLTDHRAELRELARQPIVSADPLAARPVRKDAMDLPLVLIIIGIVIALVVSYPVGIACILVGLVLLVWPRVTGR